MPISPVTMPRWKSVARVVGDLRLAIQPTTAAALDVCGFEIFTREWLAGLQQIRDAFGELHAGGPSLIDAGAGQNVGAAGAFTNARVSVAGKEGLAVAARFVSDFAPHERNVPPSRYRHK